VAVPFPLVLGAAMLADRALAPFGREAELLVLDEVRLARVPALFTSAKARQQLGYSWRSAREALEEAVADRIEKVPPVSSQVDPERGVS
jgi:hypothetical protein